MTGLINWEELRRISMPQKNVPDKEEKPQENMWDKVAPYYNQIASMELEGTINQLNCVPWTPDMTVLDTGCGPGRITCQLAKRVKSVTALDSAAKMLEKCKENVAKNGLNNVDFLFMDWHDVRLGENIKQHDVILCSRSVAGKDIEEFSKFARRYAVLIGFANGPSVPECTGELFRGAYLDEKRNQPFFTFAENRNISYNVTYNMVYDAGYEPNVNIVQDGFKKHFSTREEAYLDLLPLGKCIEAELNTNIYHANVDKFLTENNNGGFDFYIETRSSIIWWETKKRNLCFKY